MSKYAGEEVLVVPRALLEEIGMFHGIRPVVAGDETIRKLLDPANHFFMDRATAEDDPGHKQIIPYCIFRSGDSILHYTRGKAGGESRLHAQRSVGIGGHINPVDMDGGKKGPDAYQAAVSREIDEELAITGRHEHHIIALLNDDTNPVGQVHLGVVHLVELESTQVTSREDAISNLGFATLGDLAGPMLDSLETWSQHCIRHLAES